MTEIAAIIVRSLIGANPDIRTTCRILGFARKNSCILIKNSPEVTGMLRKAKDYITWGILNDDGKKALEKRRSSGKRYYLAPPRKGYGRRGVKVPFTMGGALGDRKDKINDLIIRMV